MAGRIPDSVIDDIGRRIDIVGLVGTYVHLTRKGDRWWGLCPFHSEKTPSFSVSPENNLFYCFGCQKGGGAFQFLMEMEALSFPEAVRKLAERAGVDVPEEPGDEVRRDVRKTLGELYRRVSLTFRWLLLNHPDAADAREYLASRGIDGPTSEAYRLGWAPRDGEWLYGFLMDKRYSPEFLAESGLFSGRSPQWAFFVDRLMFPVMPDAERVVAFSGRALSDKGPKYKNSPETPLYHKSRELYGLGQARDAIRTSRRVVLCEGNIDVLACHQSGIGEAVAPLGTAFTPEQARLIRKRADGVVFLFDGDDAGRRATMKGAIVAESEGLAVQAAAVPPGLDPAEILQDQGAESLKKIVEGPINIFSYLLDFLISAETVLTGEAQEEALRELTPYLKAVGSDVRRDAYLRQLAERMHADPNTVIGEFRRAGGRRLHRERPAAEVEAPFGDELYLMTAVAVRPEFYGMLREVLAPEILRDRRALSVYRAMDELAAEGHAIRTDLLLSRLDDAELVRYIIEKASTTVYSDRAEETIGEKIRVIRTRALTEERRELVAGLSRGDSDDPGIIEARMRRIKQIDGEIMKIRQGENGGNQN